MPDAAQSHALDPRRASARRTPLARSERTALVLDSAQQLFYAKGVRSVGMDELVRATGLGKATVYRLFATKDELVTAYLQRLQDQILTLVDADLERHGEHPRDALLAILDGVEESVRRADFRGCPFHNASIEYPSPDHPVRLVAAGYRRALRERLRETATALLADQAAGERLGDELALLVDGAYVSASHLGPHGPADAGLALARRLLDAATPRGE